MTVTPSNIIQYLYCPRFVYFEHVLAIPQYEEKYYKAQRGREIHEQESRRNAGYLRKKIGATDKFQNQYLTNEFLRGEADEVLVLKDGSMAPLDYKFAEYKDRVFNTYKTQLYCYAILIEDNFEKPVRKGFLVYTRSRHKLVEIEIQPAHTRVVKEAAAAIFKIISQNFFPKAVKYKKRCVSCTYKNICIQ